MGSGGAAAGFLGPPTPCPPSRQSPHMLLQQREARGVPQVLGPRGACRGPRPGAVRWQEGWPVTQGPLPGVHKTTDCPEEALSGFCPVPL